MKTKHRKRTLIIGAGEAGNIFAGELQRHPEIGLEPIGFLDDDPDKQGKSLLGLPILGGTDELTDMASIHSIDVALIAIPSAKKEFIRYIIRLAHKANLDCKTVPKIAHILDGKTNTRDAKLEDLICRDPIDLDVTKLAEYIQEKTILITGAGGSIGSELARQLCQFKPKLILLFGRGENSIFEIHQDLSLEYPEAKHQGLIGDVRDKNRLEQVFKEYQPEVVFHAAAHKHVPLMEITPSEAILNNVIGTRNIVDLCLKYQVSHLVNISTDKAVNPTSIMGASKRIAELLISSAAPKVSKGAAFMSVRFGNVLGSRGSVLLTFTKQINRGGPITVTHPDMTRYFMLPREAACLVLQAGSLAENGKVYLLDMGKPIKIKQLAEDVIKFNRAKNIEIEITGIRDGEKLYEEMLTAGEGVNATTHEDIFSAPLDQVDFDILRKDVALLEEYAHNHDYQAIRTELKRLIPENLFADKE